MCFQSMLVYDSVGLSNIRLLSMSNSDNPGPQLPFVSKLRLTRSLLSQNNWFSNTQQWCTTSDSLHYCSNENAPWIYRWHSEIENVLLPSPFFWRNFTFTCRKDFHPLLFSPSKSIWSYPSLPWAAYPTASALPFCPPRSPGPSNALLHHLRCNVLEISTGNPNNGTPFPQASHTISHSSRDSLWEWYGKPLQMGPSHYSGVPRISLKNTCYISPCDT